MWHTAKKILHPGTRKWAPTRPWVCRRLDLGLQNCECKFLLYISHPVRYFCYSSQHRLRQKSVWGVGHHCNKYLEMCKQLWKWVLIRGQRAWRWKASVSMGGPSQVSLVRIWKKRGPREIFRLREYLSSLEQNVGGNTVDKGHSEESQTETRNVWWETGRKVALVVRKQQRSWLNCVHAPCFMEGGTYRLGSWMFGEEISEQSVEGAWLLLIAFSKRREERNQIKKEAECKD